VVVLLLLGLQGLLRGLGLWRGIRNMGLRRLGRWLPLSLDEV